MHLTDEQKAFIREAIAAGRLHREEDAVKEALALWEERERARLENPRSTTSAAAWRPERIRS